MYPVKNKNELNFNIWKIWENWKLKYKTFAYERKTLVKQDFDYDAKEVLEPLTKVLTETSGKKVFAESKSNTKAIEELNETNVCVEVL